ncbi:spore morphogenesis/germination protein YwcE [Metabacillus sp. RGM 3146]|uniref:spore morphogenesis/germination protein YwcE n=1 Tax=Metabacillus sp. RGM 3146 TaxID=3401092 RepID=UPI003B9A8938
MDVFVVYLFIITATPLFLWIERRRLAIFHIPFIAGIWAYFILYLTGALDSMNHIILNTFFVANVLFAHISAFLIYAYPAIKKARAAKQESINPTIMK